MAHVSDVRVSGTSLFSRFAGLRATIATAYEQHRTYRRTLAELESLSKRELDDLGLNQYTLHAVAREAAYGA